MDTLKWSDNPGAYEWHLQRRHDNPLFPLERRAITQIDVDSARERDIADTRALAQRRRALFEAISELGGEQPWGVFEAARKELDELIERAVGIGGPASEEVKVIQGLRKLVTESMRKMAAANINLTQKFEDAERFNNQYVTTFLIPFAAQMSREGSPIPSDELVPSLLMEEPETISTFLQGVDSELRDRICYDALLLIRKALNEGVALERQDELLAILMAAKS